MKKEKLSILIVDDNIHFVRRMIGILEEVKDISFIHTAHFYEEAFGLLEKKPDLVLLDINLAGKNGINLLKKIKGSKKACEVIMLTNHVSDYYREECMRLGAMQFLDKTNEFELVPDVIRDFASGLPVAARHCSD
ncbi:MAG: response regulator [Bacteroidetes bacterium]|jgi:DNA-binding NarL/FixJ family response regulator|nr:MAG: response regulator [Bacteroidota bacterium]